MAQFSGNPSTILLVMAALLIIALLALFFITPLLAQFGLGFEALTLLLEGVGDYFGNKRVVWLGCLVVGLAICGCCVVTTAVGGAFLTCLTDQPTRICSLIGR